MCREVNLLLGKTSCILIFKQNTDAVLHHLYITRLVTILSVSDLVRQPVGFCIGNFVTEEAAGP